MRTLSIWRLLTAALLVLIGGQRYLSTQRTTGVESYHQRIKEAARRVPLQIGPWVGQNVPVPPQAVSLLDPNVILSRRYVNVENGATASVLLVHCSDAHDILGHYPPRCFRGQGWDLVDSRSRDWTAGDLRLPGMEYRFRRAAEGFGATNESSIVFANALLRPDGQVLRDMEELTRSAAGANGPLWGAGQFQVCMDASIPQEHRDAAANALLEGYRPVVDAILAQTPQRQ
jgi:hypothetical protein